MRVRLKTARTGIGLYQLAGQVVSVSVDEGKRLIAENSAEAFEAVNEQPPPETAMTQPIETAARPRPRPRKH